MRRFRRVYYDLFSRFYDSVIALHSRDDSATLRDFLVARTELKSGGLLLELCTGTGAVALRGQRATGPRGLTVGLDFSLGMIRKAKAKASGPKAESVCFVVGDVAHLPFRANTFDAVTCSHAMYELRPKVRTEAIAGAQRVLRPGGRFLMMEHCEPTRLFIRLLYQIRLATMGSPRNRAFARDEAPFLSQFFGGLKKEVSASGRSKLVSGVKSWPG